MADGKVIMDICDRMLDVGFPDGEDGLERYRTGSAGNGNPHGKHRKAG